MKNIRTTLALLFCCTALNVLAQDQSVKPGINEKFLDPGLQVVDWLKRFEIESREVYAAQKDILAACNLKPGMRIADIGAGTGLYTQPFIEAAGDSGWVYAVDISARFLEHINNRARSNNTRNVTAVLCAEDHAGLPANSIDLAFICDTYHHFEYPLATMKSIAQALSPGGTLIVVDFNRIEGVSRDWLLGHVRAGKEVFTKEIEEAGLTFVEEVNIDGLKENYCLRFTRGK
jgi:ubiquinone/menaquinone biosynthesis C-methylase UbiE